MAVICSECDPNERNIRSVDLTITPLLVQLTLLMKMTTAYLQHNNQGDLHRESLMACFMSILQNGAPARVKEMAMDIVDEAYNESMPVAREKVPGSVLPPLAACDYRTAEGQRRKRKRKGQTYIDIPKPSEKQTIAMFIANARRCEQMHSKAPLPKFGRECDRVVKDLMAKNIQSLDITIDMIPDQMGAIDTSSSLAASLTSKDTVGLKRKTMAALDSEDEDERVDSVNPKRGSSSLPTSNTNGTVDLKRKTMATLDSEDEDEPDDTHNNPRRELPQLDTVHPRRESPQSKPVSGTINAPSSSPFAKPSKSNTRKRIVAMLDSDDEDEDETVETVPPKRRPPRYKTTSQPTLSQRAIPIAAATTTQRTDKLVLQDWKPEANQESHEAETDNDTQDEPFSGSSSDSESGSESEECEGEERETQNKTSPLDTPLHLMEGATTNSMPAVPSPPSTIQLPALNLLSSEQNDDTNFDDVEFLRVAMGSSVPLDPLPSEMITRGQQQVQYQGKTIIGPVTQEIGRRGKCLVRLLREVGDLCEVVPHAEMTISTNGEFTFSVNTDIRQLYSLCTVPIEWTKLKECDKIIRTLFMVAGLQALDPQLSRFVIAEDYKMAWYPPLVGPFELQDHPLEVLHWEPRIASRLRAAVRADASFGRWVRDVTEKRQLVETIVREAGLHTGEGNGAIDLHYFACFFDHLKRVLPWIENQ